MIMMTFLIFFYFTNWWTDRLISIIYWNDMCSARVSYYVLKDNFKQKCLAYGISSRFMRVNFFFSRWHVASVWLNDVNYSHLRNFVLDEKTCDMEDSMIFRWWRNTCNPMIDFRLGLLSHIFRFKSKTTLRTPKVSSSGHEWCIVLQ